MALFGWLLLVSLSLAISLIAFIWALRTGQFSDPKRARYLPLADELPFPPAKNPAKRTAEVYALLFIGAVGFLGLLAPVLLSLWRMKGY